MSDPPLISIVTPSYNQGRFIAETIESVLRQDYPAVEHIVVDGMSTDATAEILARYPHLKVIREPDRGQAEAINKGFALARGQIYSFLNSDDVLLPGALRCVADAIRPEQGRHVIMGRCPFIDEDGHYTGIEHPSHFESFERVLAVWKGHFIPQPAVFWTAEVWRECGPMQEGLVLDYDFFCRVARRYRFHFVDRPLAAYRLHDASKTCLATDEDRLRECIRVSQRYWGSKLGLLYWKMALSLLAFRLNRKGRAHRLLERARHRWNSRRRPQALLLASLGALIGPDVATNMALLPAVRLALVKVGGSPTLTRLRHKQHPQTMALMGRKTPWDDGWVGPECVISREATGGEQTLLIQGNANLRHINRPLMLEVSVDEDSVGRVELSVSGHFSVRLKLPKALCAGAHAVRIRANVWWVPHAVNGCGDYRPLSWRWFGEESVRFQL